MQALEPTVEESCYPVGANQLYGIMTCHRMCPILLVTIQNIDGSA